MKNKIALTLIASLTSFNLFAQSGEAQGGLSEPLLWIIYIIVGLLLLVTYLLYRVTISLKKYVRGEYESEEQKMYDQRTTWEKLFQLKPVGTDQDTRINEPHDGIYELDNPPPPWFMFLFYGTILFAVIYFVRYSVTDSGMTQEQEYAAEIEAATEKKTENLEEEASFVDENTVVALTDAAAIDAGRKIYIQNCKVCHDKGGKGNVGPNLTDEYWKHGGGAKNIFKSIKYGIIDKGMTAWQDQLSPQKIQEVTSYIISLEGSNPDGAKEPEGQIWTPEEEPETEAAEEATEVTETEEVEG